MPPRSATRTDITLVRQRLDELPKPPHLPDENAVAKMFEGEGNAAFIDDTGEFAHAHWSEVNQDTTIIYLLPEGPDLLVLAPVALAVLDAIADKFPQAQGRIAGGTFQHGSDPVTGLEDYGESKANAWADFVQGQGAHRLSVDPVYDSAGVRVGTRASMTLALMRSSLRLALGGI